MIEKEYKIDGFLDERLIVIPQTIRESLIKDPLAGKLYPTDIGYFPRAAKHKRNRPSGAGETICIFCTGGRGWVNAGGDSIEVGEKDIVLIPAGLGHSYGAHTVDPWSIYWFHFSGEEVPLFLPDGEPALFRSVLQKNSELIFTDLFDRIYFSLERGYNKGNMVIVSRILGYLLSVLFFSGNRAMDDTAKSSEMAERSISHMKRHLGGSLSLEEMAEHVRYSVPHYSAVFRKKTGQSPVRYYLHLKIQKACLLLDTTGESIAEIGRKVGFEDPYYFSRIFRKIMGRSPRNYRKIKKG